MSKKQIISEGRYDSFTRTIVKDIMDSIKLTESIGKDYVINFMLPSEKDGEDFYLHESGIEFELDLSIQIADGVLTYGNREIPFYVNTYIADDDTLVMEIVIDKDYSKEFYQQIFYKISEDVRHEIEHYTQNIFPHKNQPIQNTAEYETTFAHHMDPSEVEALVHGFYRRAKLEKKPLDEVMFEDIQKDIQDGNLTISEGDALLRMWVKYAVNNLPKAQYSNSFRRQFIIQK